MSYNLTLNATEERVLRGMSDKGYDCGLYAALMDSDTRIDGEEIATYTIPEHVIWPLCETYESEYARGNEPFGPYRGPLVEKLHKLFESVV